MRGVRGSEPVNVAFSGNRVLADDHVKMRSSGWTLTQHDRVFTKGKVRHGHVQREGRVRTHTGRKNSVWTLELLSYQPRSFQKLGKGPGRAPGLVPSEGAWPR